MSYMKIAFVSVRDPNDPRTWSGIPSDALAHLVRAGGPKRRASDRRTRIFSMFPLAIVELTQAVPLERETSGLYWGQ
jgi:hypothetical protein